MVSFPHSQQEFDHDQPERDEDRPGGFQGASQLQPDKQVAVDPHPYRLSQDDPGIHLGFTRKASVKEMDQRKRYPHRQQSQEKEEKPAGAEGGKRCKYQDQQPQQPYTCQDPAQRKDHFFIGKFFQFSPASIIFYPVFQARFIPASFHGKILQ